MTENPQKRLSKQLIITTAFCGKRMHCTEKSYKTKILQNSILKKNYFMTFFSTMLPFATNDLFLIDYSEIN